MSNRQYVLERTVLDAADSTETGTSINVKDFRHITLIVGTASSANLTVKFQGAASDDAPTFSSAQSVSNHWDYVGAYDYEDGTLIDGDTGFSVSGTDDFRLLTINTDGLSWINATVTARSAGSVTVKASCFQN